jgi:hypothetical protein
MVHTLKTLREALCRQQVNLEVPESVELEVGMLINLIDFHRPLGADGKHGNLHTETCGCEDKP